MENRKKRGWSFSVLCMAVVIWLWSQLTVVAANPQETEDITMGHGAAAEEVVVAKVNGTVINMAQLMRAMSEVSMKKYRKQEVSPLLADKIKREATDKLIVEELVFQSARAKVKAVPAERLEAKIQAVKNQYKSEAEYQQYVKDEFGGMEGFRHHLERFLIIELFVAQEFESKALVSEQEIQEAYEASKTQVFVKDEFVQVNDLIFFFDPADPETKGKIEKIKQSIIDKHDNDPTKIPTDGTFTVEKNVPLDKAKDKLLYEAAKGLKQFGWTAPIDVDGNLHIAQLIGYKPAVNKSLQDVTPYLTTEIKKQKRQALLDAWMAGLKNGASIEIMDLTQ